MAAKKLTDNEVKSKEVLNDGILEANKVLNDAPDALRVEVMTEEGTGKHYWMFVNNDKESVDVRQKVREILVDMWGKGAYNYDQLARQLRVQPLDVQMLIDQEYEEGKGGVIVKNYDKVL